MARQRGIIKLDGTIAGLSFIKSARYGDHVRAARGTYKEAKVNDVFQANADKADIITGVGSPILQQLKALEAGFHSGDLWARMMRRMHKAGSAGIEDLLESLKGIEVNERYAFGKLFAVLPKLETAQRKGWLVVEMEVAGHPVFPREVKAREYLCALAVLFYNGKQGWTMERMETEWISFQEEASIWEMKFQIPRGARYFLMVAGVQAGKDGKAIESFAGKGYCVSGWGKC